MKSKLGLSTNKRIVLYRVGWVRINHPALVLCCTGGQMITESYINKLIEQYAKSPAGKAEIKKKMRNQCHRKCLRLFNKVDW